MTGSIPDGVWTLPNLTSLDLSNLAIRGTIPTEIGLMKLGLLDLSENPVLTGTIPSEIGSMPRIRRLDISDNLGVTGTIPTEIGNMKSLRAFVVMGTAVGGQIPTEIGRLPNLSDFNVRGSQLESSIPTEVGLLTALRQWDQLFTKGGIGTIPTEFGLLTTLQRLVLPEKLEGTLPVQLSYLTKLRTLVVPAGSVTGTIPATFGQLNSLQVLALSQQRLTGSIPLTFGALTNIRKLTVWYCRRCGLMAHFLFADLFLTTRSKTPVQFEIQNNTITGTIPQNLREWTRVTRIVVQNTNLTGLAGRPLCASWTQQYEMYGDCDEFEDNCPCCTQCCVATSARCSPRYNTSDDSPS
eukprot:Nitzschia sp. Nitz4//scaffold97_size77645//76458//77591//NITZ4_005531-RA/size77645-exonerate_protein2genome-gene-0.12-mRNA-1//-1//CDS//3329560695//4596//frame0